MCSLIHHNLRIIFKYRNVKKEKQLSILRKILLRHKRIVFLARFNKRHYTTYFFSLISFFCFKEFVFRIVLFLFLLTRFSKEKPAKKEQKSQAFIYHALFYSIIFCIIQKHYQIHNHKLCVLNKEKKYKI